LIDTPAFIFDSAAADYCRLFIALPLSEFSSCRRLPLAAFHTPADIDID
jgi:hypothetical protein